MRIDLMSWKFVLKPDVTRTRFLKGVLFSFPIILIVFFVFLKLEFNKLYLDMAREDSFIEYAQSLIYFLSSLFAFSVGIGFLKNKLRLYGWLYIILSLGFIFVCAEEISWGQRIFDMTPGDYFKKHNLQFEITLHNLDTTQPYLGELFMMIGLFGSFSWLIMPRKVRANYSAEMNYFIPDWFLTFYFFPMFFVRAYFAYVSWIVVRWSGINAFRVGNQCNGYFIGWKDSEPAELLLSLGFLLFVMINKHRQKTDKMFQRDTSVRFVLALVACSLLAAVALHMIHTAARKRFDPYPDIIMSYSMLKKGRVQEGVHHASKALLIDPFHPVAHNNMGTSLAMLGRIDEAISHYEEALRVNPYATDVHNNLGNVLAGRGRIDEAISHYEEALRRDPDLPGAHNNLGNVLAEQGKTDKAIVHYFKALQTKPDSEGTHCNLANALASQGRMDEAIAHYIEAVRIEPDYEQAHHNLGAALYEQGRFDEAVAHFREALRIKPGYISARRNLNLALRQAGKHNEESNTFTGP